MQDLVARLKGTQQAAHLSLSSNRTGQRTVSRPYLHVGLWPIRSESSPEVAMGLATLLGYLLECWPAIRVYRLFASLHGKPDKYEWMIKDSQFDVDDWQPDGLDENVAIWGTFDQIDQKYILKLEVENDFTEFTKENDYSDTWTFASLSDLLNALPEIAQKVATYLAVADVNSRLPAYAPHQWEESDIKAALKAVFQWELKLMLHLWGQPWNTELQWTTYESLFAVSARLNQGLGDWIVANAAARILSPLYFPLGESFLQKFKSSMFDSNWSLGSCLVLSQALLRLGLTVDAYDLLESHTERHPTDTDAWLALAHLYWNTNEPTLAIEVAQRAIRAGHVSAAIYSRYAEFLLIVKASDLVVDAEELILIGSDRAHADPVVAEFIEAYKKAIDLEPDNAGLISHLLTQLIGVKSELVWNYFKRLIEVDSEGTYVRDILELMYVLDDLTPAIEMLERATSAYSGRVDIYLNLAFVYLLDEQVDLARHTLEKISPNEDVEVKAEIERLMLSIRDPEFDAQLAEITNLVDSGNKLSTEDVEFLEDMVATAPLFADGYILLAKAYANWGETADSLDVLLDGQQHLPNNPDIIVSLSQTLWQLGEEQLALDYLGKSILNYPDHITTLAIMGRLLFEAGHEQAAKTVLSKAESLDASHYILRETQGFIARRIN